MKLTHYIYISTALMMLTACGDDVDPVYTVGEADNAIVLMAGVRDGGEKVQTRAVDGNHANGGGHVPFTTGTKLALRVDGTWLGKEPADISKSTTATLGAESSTDSKHNVVSSYAPGLYWDDYGTADPDNMAPKVDNGGRQKGLTIYGAAVDGVTTAPVVSSWTELSWDLDANQTGGWASKDLLTSNNIQPVVDLGGGQTKYDGTYKFDDWKNSTNPSNLLEFTHAMSKVTVKLHAENGFPDCFEEEVSVTLKDFYLKGNVNIIAKTTTGDGAKSDVQAWKQEGTIGKPGGTRDLTYSALVYPGRSFSSDEEVILLLSADGNDYSVTAAKLKKAIADADQSALEQGYNYVLDITVNKTAVYVEATILNWKEVKAETVAPKININETYGHEGAVFKKPFDLYRSANLDGSYLGTGDHSVITPTEITGGWSYTFGTPLYWPNHSYHYFFRGVWPQVGDGGTPTAYLSGDKTQIAVTNVKYESNTFPSDLMIGRPLRDDDATPDETCKVAEHNDGNGDAAKGICATEGKIYLNFHYMMSQVIVKLETSKEGDEGYPKNSVTFNDKTKVEIVDGYSDGAILLGSCTSDFTGKDKGDYEMNKKVESGTTHHDIYHDAVIPQSLVSITEADGVQTKTPTLKFRITVEDNGLVDEYETVLGISEIMVQEQTSLDEWGEAKKVDAWEPGKIYTYTLMITKTGIQVKATLTDWIKVKADDIVWF